MERRLVCLWIFVAFVASARADVDDVPTNPPNQAATEFFEAKVRPVLVANCMTCHGPEKQKSGLRVDSREALLKGGENGPAVVPGKPDESLLVAAVRHDGDIKMPPKNTLPPEVVGDLERWVKQGAQWPQSSAFVDPRQDAWKRHWAFQPLTNPAIPKVTDASWIHSPIDAFVLSKLEIAGLSPSVPADRRTLIRRATFDLIGLPPTPEEIDAFESDKDATQIAFSKVIDRLLASPHYGERWGRHWLDVARYADTKGYVFVEDAEFHWAFTYRDYVIEAFNRDLPFDRFILEQLAADKSIEGKDKSSLRALGFLTVGSKFMNNQEDVLDDRVDVTTRGLMGLTVSCARCHDHKFDPVPTADYYSLRGVFASSSEPNLPPLFAAPPDTPEYRAYEAELEKRESEFNNFVKTKFDDMIELVMKRAGEYIKAAETARHNPDTKDFMQLADGMDLNPKMIRHWQNRLEHSRKGFDPVFAIFNALADVPTSEFTAKSSEVVAKFASEAEGGRRINPLVLERMSQPPLKSLGDAAERLGGLLWSTELVWRDYSARTKLNGTGAARLPNDAHEELRLIFHSPGSPTDVPFVPVGDLDLIPDRPSQEQLKKLRGAVDEWRKSGTGAPPRAMVVEDLPQPVEPRIFRRGNPGNQGEAVPRRFPAIASGSKRETFATAGRLETAQAIVSRENPLTARVFVNRVWLHHFGKPLVSTPSDFGMRSDPPSHPDLLDNLAWTFIEDGWSIKRLHRRMMLSSVYQQASVDRPDGVTADPENRLYWRAERRPLDFEALRDSILAVSGRLDKTIGGPSIPSLAEGGSLRRTLYCRIDRNNLAGLFRTFDFPTPDATNPIRDSTTVPPQSLFLMNNPWVIESAQATLKRPEIAGLAERAERVNALCKLFFGRPASELDQSIAAEFINKDLGGWPRYVQALMMSNEFFFVD